ncbi:MAG: polyprenyl diphosphate synthase [Candidatus Promineifilaceae bacterium]|nr:polyprenyl diphosphate synthase [Candidatus Promineifilaceae bacterium]
MPQFNRLPKHIGFIPDGNRRWAETRGLPQEAGYAAGIEPGFQLMKLCRSLGIQEVSVYGFTKENVRRPGEQVAAFREATASFGVRAVEAGVALLAVGDCDSHVFPDALRPFASERSPGDIKVNLLVNYGWQWDFFSAIEAGRENGEISYRSAPQALASGQVSRIDLIIRWGGRRRLSGFLPIQSAYADFYVVDDLWPDFQPEHFLQALTWYQEQDITLGG